MSLRYDATIGCKTCRGRKTVSEDMDILLDLRDIVANLITKERKRR